jgi:hypothetical protein
VPLTKVYQLLEQAQDELRAIAPEQLAAAQRPAVDRLREHLDVTVELAFAAGNAGEPQG